MHEREPAQTGTPRQQGAPGQPVLRSVLEAASERAVPTTLSKATLTELCHTLEDQVLHEDLAGVIVAGFQRVRHWEVERDRYARLCADPKRQALILAAGTPRTPLPARVTYVEVGTDHPLAREWFVLALTERFSAMLFGRELAARSDAPEHERSFLTVWSFDPIVVSELVALLESAIVDLDPRAGRTLSTAVRRFPPRRPVTGAMPRFGNAVFERLEARGRRWRQVSLQLQEANQELRKRRVRLAQLQQRATVGTVAGQLAHRLHDPLSAITLAADSLRSASDADDRRHLIDLIEQQVLRAADLTSQLEQLATPGPAELVEVDLVGWLADEVTTLQLSGFEVAAALDDGHDGYHRIDPEHLAQALAETVRTAHDASERSGPVTIRVECRPTHGRIVVEHDGVPPSSEQLAALRTPVGEVDLTDRTSTALATARSHLETQAGTLAAEVTDDGIVRFSLTIGTAPPEVAARGRGQAVSPGERTGDAPARPVRAGTSPAERTALIVDDEPAMRGLLEALLRRAGWQVRTAGSLDGAARVLASTETSLLLLDVELCGNELATRLAELERHRPGITTRTVLLASHPPGSGTLAGHPVATKPFVWADLERAIESAAPADPAAL
ncbi:MAG: DICT sensory domain-containing protein [Nitriliruptoraceae bacterium]